MNVDFAESLQKVYMLMAQRDYKEKICLTRCQITESVHVDVAERLQREGILVTLRHYRKCAC